MVHSSRQARFAVVRSDSGESSYLMTVGGSDAVGFFGYVEAFNEMLSQDITDGDVTSSFRDVISDIVFTCGSGGTGEGLGAASFLATNCHVK